MKGATKLEIRDIRCPRPSYWEGDKANSQSRLGGRRVTRRIPLGLAFPGARTIPGWWWLFFN